MSESVECAKHKILNFHSQNCYELYEISRERRTHGRLILLCLQMEL